MVTIIRAKIALAKLTNDSIASDNSPTESVTYQASVLSVMVITATPTEAHSSRCGVSMLARRAFTGSSQSDPRELALAHLQHEGARSELEAFVAHHAAVDP